MASQIPSFPPNDTTYQDNCAAVITFPWPPPRPDAVHSSRAHLPHCCPSRPSRRTIWSPWNAPALWHSCTLILLLSSYFSCTLFRLSLWPQFHGKTFCWHVNLSPRHRHSLKGVDPILCTNRSIIAVNYYSFIHCPCKKLNPHCWIIMKLKETTEAAEYVPQTTFRDRSSNWNVIAISYRNPPNHLLHLTPAHFDWFVSTTVSTWYPKNRHPSTTTTERHINWYTLAPDIVISTAPRVGKVWPEQVKRGPNDCCFALPTMSIIRQLQRFDKEQINAPQVSVSEDNTTSIRADKDNRALLWREGKKQMTTFDFSRELWANWLTTSLNPNRID